MGQAGRGQAVSGEPAEAAPAPRSQYRRWTYWARLREEVSSDRPADSSTR
jgi:hypothetical protein